MINWTNWKIYNITGYSKLIKTVKEKIEDKMGISPVQHRFVFI